MSTKTVAIVTAVDSNARYRGCAAYFTDSWRLISSRSKHKYIPVVLDLGSKETLGLLPFLKAKGIPTSFAAQNLRALAAGIQGADYAITSDVDMLPASSRMFDNAIDELELRRGVLILRDVLEIGQYPICYTVASVKDWASMTNIRDRGDLGAELERLWERVLESEGYDDIHGGQGWHFDQEYLYQIVSAFEENGGRVTRMSDAETGHRRLDRSLRFTALIKLLVPLVKRNFYSDFHIPLPAEQFSTVLGSFMRALEAQEKGR